MINEHSSRDVSSVIITDELDRRPSRAPDYKAETEALTLLAEAMSSGPDAGLQCLVDMTVKLTRCDSAGISFLEPGGKHDNFRWVAVAGSWESYRDGTMPREESPCGEIIAQNAVLLMEYPERVFPALLQAEPRIHEGLLAPFEIDGEPAGTVWAIKHSTEASFDAEDARLLKSLARFASVGHRMAESLRYARASGHKSEEKYRTLFNSMDEAYAVVEVLKDDSGNWSDFRFLDANPAFMKHTSMPYPVGKTATELLGEPNPRWAKLYGEAVESGKALRVEQTEETLGRTFDLNIFSLDRERNIVAVLFADISERCLAQERQKLLLAELQHRVRNILSMIRAVVRQSSEGHSEVEGYVAHLVGRLDALARTQVLLTRSAGAQVYLEELVRDELESQLADENCVTVSGPEVCLSPKAAEVLALALHELATNSVKYGALFDPNGKLSVTWGVAPIEGQSWLQITWEEACVQVEPQLIGAGFGTELIEDRVPYELRGEASLHVTGGGVRCEIAFPLADIASVLETGPGRGESE